MSNEKDSFEINEWMEELLDLNDDTDFPLHIYYTAVRDIIYDFNEEKKPPPTKDEILKRLLKKLKDKNPQKSIQERRDQLRKGMERALSLQINRKEIVRKYYKRDTRYGISENFDLYFPDNMNYDSKTQSKTAKKIVFSKVHHEDADNLEPQEKLYITLPYWQKTLEKYARVNALYQISKLLYSANNKQTNLFKKYVGLYENFLKSNMQLIKKQGYLEEFYRYLNALDLNDLKSNEEVNSQVSNRYTEKTDKKFIPPKPKKIR